MIETKRLRLVPATIATLQAEQRGAAWLAAELGLEVPVSWPPELYDSGATEFTLRRLEAMPDEGGWWIHYMVVKETGTVVGACGYKGPPAADGTVEVGYSVLSEHRCRGYATEAVAGMVQRAFIEHDAQRVIAETLPALTASIGVLSKSGFRHVGAGSEPGVIRYELERTEWTPRESSSRPG